MHVLQHFDYLDLLPNRNESRLQPTQSEFLDMYLHTRVHGMQIHTKYIPEDTFLDSCKIGASQGLLILVSGFQDYYLLQDYCRIKANLPLCLL